MNSVVELDDLFDEATRTLPSDQTLPAESCSPSAEGASGQLEQLLNQQLPALRKSIVALETLKVAACRVDGRIIGTGEADFTKGNTCYTLNYKGKTFQLIDVPGIEGDENKYVDEVRKAVAKAHLVFYVNGTNKKPEKATAEKIRDYLRRGTQVCPLVNIRGNADAYEFEEDRASLESHGGAGSALQQTMGVLESVLGTNVMLGGLCVQGLLAFSSLAINPVTGSTSIHHARDRDLLIQQRNYRKHFASNRAMCEFSQIKAVAQVLHGKLGTFREDIIESNKVKVRELLTENIEVLQLALKEHQTFITRIKPEFEKCRIAIEHALHTFEQLIFEGRTSIWNEFFNGLSEEADDIVAEHFGDNDRITAKIKKAFQVRQEGMGARLQAQFEECVGTLQDSVSQAMERLIHDVRRVEYQQRIAFGNSGLKAVYDPAQLGAGLDMSDYGSLAFNIGSYALAGAGFGTFIGPGIGNAIGAAIGAVVGILISVMGFFVSKDKRVRKAQAQVQTKIDEVREQVIAQLPEDVNSLVVPVRKELTGTTLSQVDDIYMSMSRPLEIIQQQIALMNNVKDQLEEMPHGTIQAIQR